MSYSGRRKVAVKSVRARSVSKKRKLVKRVSKKRSLSGKPGLDRTVGFYGKYGPARDQLVGRNTPELKFYDISYNQTVSASSPRGGSIVNIAQGAGVQQRVGRKCIITSVQYAVSVLALDPLFAADHVVVYVVQDRQANGQGIAYTDVFDFDHVIGNGFRVVSNSERFRVLRRIDVCLKNTAGINATYANAYDNCHGFFDVNIPLEFNGATGANVELKSNSIGYFIGCQNTIDMVQYSVHFRLRFSDV